MIRTIRRFFQWRSVPKPHYGAPAPPPKPLLSDEELNRLRALGLDIERESFYPKLHLDD